MPAAVDGAHHSECVRSALQQLHTGAVARVGVVGVERDAAERIDGQRVALNQRRNLPAQQTQRYIAAGVKASRCRPSTHRRGAPP